MKIIPQITFKSVLQGINGNFNTEDKTDYLIVKP